MWRDLVPEEQYVQTEEATLPGRAARYAAVPEKLHPEVRAYLDQEFGQLYAQQAGGLEAILNGHDICLATSAASGKSLVFMAAAVHRLLRHPNARCLVLYPAKALIMDQLKRWNRWAEAFKLGVGHIHGDVDSVDREAIITGSQIVLMTPDVAHAWLMSRVGTEPVSSFLRQLAILVLDEAHVYQGVFGSNMAYFMRRFHAVAADFQLVMATATLAQPGDFAHQLTGREVAAFGPNEDGSSVPDKHVVVIVEKDRDTFQSKVNLLKRIAARSKGHFLAFADSRRMVEQLVAAVCRGDYGGEDQEGDNEQAEDLESESEIYVPHGIVPYRSGYEDHDRRRIQEALDAGKLAGVVSTSALELGLDIGQLDVVVMLGLPPTMKAFWQRMGRAGRRHAGVCLVVDSGGVIASVYGGLESYLKQELEPNWLYLDNRKIQYTNALCAAREIDDIGVVTDQKGPFRTLPERFRNFLQNEINPTQSVENDLLELKQRAEGGPHIEFPIRSGIEPSFRIKDRRGDVPLGSITLSQVLREAYPGAIYYYMARPFRVYRFRVKAGEIIVKRERPWQTKPISRTMVFPDLVNGNYNVYRSEEGFLTETEMQVSEQVLGFKERRGPNEITNEYGLRSPYWNKPLNRYFRTTGVCWSFPSEVTCSSAAVGAAILQAYCIRFGIQSRDLGYGSFHANTSPFSDGAVRGMAVYDATDGSLRLTQRLAENFLEVVQAAIPLAKGGDPRVSCSPDDLQHLHNYVRQLQSLDMVAVEGGAEADGDWVTVIARGEQAMYLADGTGQMVKVITYRYTPKGLKYQLQHREKGVVWMVAENMIQPLHGQTRLLRVNLTTGDEEVI